MKISNKKNLKTEFRYMACRVKVALACTLTVLNLKCKNIKWQATFIKETIYFKPYLTKQLLNMFCMKF